MPSAKFLWRQIPENREKEYARRRASPDIKTRQAARRATLEHQVWYKEYRSTPEYAEHRHERDRIKWATDPNYRLSKQVATQMRSDLRGRKNGRHWEDLVGYTKDELKTHLQEHWLPGMTWDNYGKSTGWVIDHIIPRSLWKFETADDPEFKQCWALANLQPLGWRENLIKNNRTIYYSGG